MSNQQRTDVELVATKPSHEVAALIAEMQHWSDAQWDYYESLTEDQ